MGWITAGTGAAAGISAILTGVFAQQKHDELSRECGGPCPASFQGDIDRGRRLSRASTALTFTSVAALGAGVTLIILGSGSDDGDDAPADATTATITPTFGPGAVGGQITVTY